MNITQQTNILNKLSRGLPICDEPYRKLAEECGIDEDEILKFIREIVDTSVICRLGMVFNHEAVGYVENAIIVWDIPDDEIDQVGVLLGLQEKISLCYKRPRQKPDWPYNLFTMIHGKTKNGVIAELNAIVKENSIEKYPFDLLFSTKTYKHSGARYDW